MILDIVIPCKAFRLGKSRLSNTLDPPLRASFCRELFKRSVTIGNQIKGRQGKVVVVTDDLDVARTGKDLGATIVSDPGHGLNAALSRTNMQLDVHNAILVMPIDLPFSDAREILAFTATVQHMGIVPDHTGTGTNLLMLTSAARREFPFAFGPESFELHLSLAAEKNIHVTICESERLGTDIDTAEDFLKWRTSLSHLLRSDLGTSNIKVFH